MAIIDAIYRYPVKGLTPERLSKTQLNVGATLPGDRAYAIENGPTGFNPVAPQYQPKIRYLQLMKNERLAQLDARYDDASGVLAIRRDGQEVVHGDLATADGRAAIETFFADYCSD